MAKSSRRGLGRGLSALIPDQPAPQHAATYSGDEAAPADGNQILHLDPGRIESNPEQPRRHFDEESLQELAQSIRRDGVQEPVIVRRRNNRYELVSGERRVRASIMADASTVPAICREVSDGEMLKFGLIENIQREDLNAIELAQAYKRLIDEFGWTQEQLANEVGKQRATVANTLRLLSLPPEVQEHVAMGRLTMGHARALITADDPDFQLDMCRKIIEQDLSVRQTERMAAARTEPRKPEKTTARKDPNIASIEDELRRTLGARVSVRQGKNNRGKIEIEYANLDEFERLLGLFRKST